jgi:glycosyltransferase involved in cell wall biosynthesis
MPSICYETFGLTLLEAFREGTPVIARRLGSLTEIVEQSGGGVLFSDAGELRAVMERMRADVAHRDALAAAGRKAFLARWTEEKVVPRYVALLRDAARRKGDARLAHILQ